MKKIIYISFVALLGILLTQCTKDPQNNTAGTVEGGYVTVDNANLNYVVGDGGTYSFDMHANQNSDSDISKIHVYKSAHIYVAEDSSTYSTNEILVETKDVAGTTNATVASNGYSYDDLISGLTLLGDELPASDGALTIGDKFVFRIVSEMSDGRQVQQAYTVDLTVSTRFAGTYVVSGLQYFRIGVQSPSYWEGLEVVVKSIDAVTYEYDWGTAIGWEGPLYFQVDADNNISYPAEWAGAAQALNGQPLITCELNLSDLANVPCDGSNIVIKDDVNGKDQLVLTYGYFTAGSGPREFTETLTKK